MGLVMGLDGLDSDIQPDIEPLSSGLRQRSVQVQSVQSHHCMGSPVETTTSSHDIMPVYKHCSIRGSRGKPS
jgi:hypothetical protein